MKYKNATKLSYHHIVAHKIHKIKSSEYFRVFILRTIGNFLVLSSLLMIVKTFYLPVREEIRYYIDKKAQKKYIVSDVKKRPNKLDRGSIEPKGSLARILNVKPVEILTPEDPNFSIIIPKIGANAKVLANIDAANENTYLTALQYGVAHTLGTAFPGEGGHIFLFAHSTDYFWNVGSYNAIFYLLYKLDKGDEINIFYQGQRYLYHVTDKKIIDASQVEYLTRKTNREFLTLQTCWPPGTTFKRLLILATRAVD